MLQWIKRIAIGTLCVLLAACAAAPVPAPTPTAIPPVTQNADWIPVFETFAGLEMALVPPGCFMMGSDEGRRDERPAHDLCFDAPFYIGRTEITNAQYGSAGNAQGDQQPRENLTWVEARDFCASKGLRLPTEAEWEYAARGVESWIYPWGNVLIPENLVFDQNSSGQTADVGSRPGGTSWVGALDMAGNVFEWTSSHYARYPYDAADGRENVDDLSRPRVFRGGVNSYIDFGASAHTRFEMAPDGRDWFVGFRCARSG
ncbi:MAG: formylglycine-generating enzyme family protein [bacterium]|nr:formylglycine-generating enzyme family protein [bacterium]